MTPFSPILLEAYNPGPMTGRGNNTYLVIEGGKRAVLIDTGVGDPRHLSSIARELAVHQAQLECVLVTHGHADHASGAPHVATRFPKAVFSKFPWPDEDGLYDVNWRALVDGEQVALDSSHLVALHTPGHSPDHLSFWHDPTRSAFTGDLVVQGGSVMIHATGGGNLAEYLASLARLIDLRPVTLFPAHGPIVTDPIPILNGYIEHRLSRERQILGAVREGRTTVPEIAESIYDGLEPTLMRAAHENVRAHLTKLKAEGRVFVEHDRWTT